MERSMALGVLRIHAFAVGIPASLVLHRYASRVHGAERHHFLFYFFDFAFQRQGVCFSIHNS